MAANEKSLTIYQVRDVFLVAGAGLEPAAFGL